MLIILILWDFFVVSLYLTSVYNDEVLDKGELVMGIDVSVGVVRDVGIFC